MEITFVRALKIWWSIAWRGMALMLVVVVPLQALMFAFVFPMMPKSGQKHDAQAIQHMSFVMMIAWPIVTAAVIGVQAQSIRSMLKKARWSDFKLTLSEREDASTIPPPN